MQRGREMLTIFAHNSLVAGVTFSPDGHRLASSSYDHTVRIWDATPLTSDPLAPHCVTLTGHKDKVSVVAFSPDGRWLASASWDHTIKLWELSNSGESRASPPRAVVSTRLGAITLRHTLRGHHGIVTGVAFSPDNRTLASVKLGQYRQALGSAGRSEGDSLTERLSIPLAQRVEQHRIQPRRPAPRYRPGQRDRPLRPGQRKAGPSVQGDSGPGPEFGLPPRQATPDIGRHFRSRRQGLGRGRREAEL